MTDGDVTVATFDSKTQALMTVDTLKAEGVPSAYVPDEALEGSTGSTLQHYPVRVRSADAELAKRILADFGIGQVAA
jgi:hypothetical protein